MRLSPSAARALSAATALAACLAGSAGAPRAAHADPADDPAERGDPFWPTDASPPDAGTRRPESEVLGYPWWCACRAAARSPVPVSPGQDHQEGGGLLVGSAALLAAAAAAGRRRRRARAARTPCAPRRPD